MHGGHRLVAGVGHSPETARAPTQKAQRRLHQHHPLHRLWRATAHAPAPAPPQPPAST